MGEPTLERVLQEALRQYEKQARVYAPAKQCRPESNRRVAAQTTKMVSEKRKEWSKLTSLNDLTLAVCSILYDEDDGRTNQFKRNFLKFAVEGRDPEPSIGSTETSEESEESDEMD